MARYVRLPIWLSSSASRQSAIQVPTNPTYSNFVDLTQHINTSLIQYQNSKHGSYGQGKSGNFKKSGKVREKPDGQGKSGNSKVPWCKS